MDKNREQTLLIIAGVVIATVLICGLGGPFLALFGATRVVVAPAAMTVLPLTPTTAVIPTTATPREVVSPTASPTQPPAASTESPLATPLEAAPYQSTTDHRGSAYMVWQQTDASGHCRQARVGGTWLEVSVCDGGDAIVYPLSAERQDERLQLTSVYTSFEADTKDGRLEFYAEDGLYASSAEARLIASWVAGLVQEVETGQTPETPLVLTWQRHQDNQCQQLHVTLTGIATAFSCDDGVAIELAQAYLMPEKLAQLYDLYDRLGSVQAEPSTFVGQGSAALNNADKQAIERFAEGVFAPMYVSAAADTGVVATPMAQAPYIRFAGWSPDSRWFAYWRSTDEDVARQENPIQPPPGTLTFTHVETGENCVMPAFDDNTQAPGLAWTADDRVMVYLDNDTVSGLPCQPDSFMVDNEAAAQTTVTPDSRLSANGRYRIQTEILDETANPVPVRTTMFAGGSDQPLHIVEWQSPSYVDGCCVTGWVSPSQYLINETMERPLLIDAERGVLDVPLDIFKVQPLPPDPNNNLTLYHALALPSAARDQFHLLLTVRGSSSEAFPSMLLYHAERDLVETLPAYWDVWHFSPGSEWIQVSEEIGTGHLLSRDRRSAGYNLWGRRLEDVDEQWQLIAPAMDAVFWNEAQSEVAYIQTESTVVWQTFPEGMMLGRWQTDPYGGQIYFSPNGRYLVTVGSVSGLLDHALFVLERDTRRD